MIPYVGLPVTPATAAVAAVSGGHAFVSFAHPQQLGIATQYCQSFAVDNGAFPAWVNNRPITDWQPYYVWVADLCRYPNFTFAVIPDVIDGDENANDALIREWPAALKRHGAPVWHMHESIDRLVRLAAEWHTVCIGSSGEYASVGSKTWWLRMADAMDAVCDADGFPICKLHGLRMLDPAVFSRLPLSSADSTNIGRNVGIDKNWTGSYQPPTKEARAAVMRMILESNHGAVRWDRSVVPLQENMFDLFGDH